MEFEGRRKASHVPNLTPLIDIVFLLLVFFMLTAHFVRDEAISVVLPEAESAAVMAKTEPVEIVIDSGGKLLFKGEELDKDDLGAALKSALAARDEKVVTIRGDRAARLDAAVWAIDAARAAGAGAVDIVTVKPDK